MNHSSCLPRTSRIFKCLASGIGKAAATAICIASAPCLLAQVPVLELQKSTDGMASWQKVHITQMMLTLDGRLQMSNEPGPVFYRMKMEMDSPPQLGDMVFIPGGSFEMGDAFNEGSSIERPLHSVTLSGFFLQNTEVTKAQWDAVAEWAMVNGYDIMAEGGIGKATNHPVHNVTWYEVVKYCNARSEMEGLVPCYTVGGVTYKTGTSTPDCNWNVSGYRLPTEAEWERAARGGLSGMRFPWGDIINHSYANYLAEGSPPSYDTNGYTTFTYHPTYNNGVTPYTSPVGSFPSNTYGLCEMVGNLREWCWDRFASGYYSSSPNTDPRGPDSGSNRVTRGGGWETYVNNCRVAARANTSPSNSLNDVGFRPARGSVP